MFNHITALFASQVWSLFSAPTFFIPVFLIFLFGEDQPSQLSPLPVFCSTRLCLCVLWDQNLVINSIIRSFTRLLTLSLAYLTVNENPPIILFPSEFLPRCFGSFASSLFFCTFRCPPWAFPHTHTTCSLEKPIHILHNSAQISPHSFIHLILSNTGDTAMNTSDKSLLSQNLHEGNRQWIIEQDDHRLW